MSKCGWCITDHHVDCKKQTMWMDQKWDCDCECGEGKFA